MKEEEEKEKEEKKQKREENKIRRKHLHSLKTGSAFGPASTQPSCL